MKSILLPTRKENVMDLVRLAGINVSDWVNYKGKSPAANPKYCYDWSFIEPGKVIVLNLWYEDIIEEDDTLFSKYNFRENMKYYRDTFKKPIWERRALKMDNAIQTALRDNLVVRAIICNGIIKRRNTVNPEASKVENRKLDPLPWTISEYNWANGDCKLERGLKEIRTTDQFDLIDKKDTPKPEKKEVTSSVYSRNPNIRRKVLSRSNNRCEYCGETGFLTAIDRYYLETHHIISLSEKGDDNELNVIALCPNHHRIAHFGKDKLLVQAALKRKINEMYGSEK